MSVRWYIYANAQRMPRHQVKLMQSDDQQLPDQFLQRLGLAPNCTKREVRNAYLQLAKSVHPDHGGDAHFFQQLQCDYEKALKYVGNRRSLKVHSFFLSPWNPNAEKRVRRRALSTAGFTVFAVLLCSLLAMLLTDSIVLPLLVLGCGYLGIHLVVTSLFHPAVSLASLIAGIFLFVFSLTMLIQDDFFSRALDQYASVSDISAPQQLQIALLGFSVLFIATSGLSLLAAITDRL